MKDMEDIKESRKNDLADDKLRWELLPLPTIEKIVEVYHFGAKKYAPNSWQNLPDGKERYRAALLRHMAEIEKGNDVDTESGLLHAAHLAWNAIAMLHFAIKEQDKQNYMI